MASKTKKNLAYQFMYQILAIVLPLITAPYVSRKLGATNIGLYSYSYSVVSYFVLFSKLGIDNYGNKLIASVKKNKDDLNTAFSNLFTLHFILSIFVVFVYILYIIFSGDNVLYASICSVYLIGAMFDVNWFFFGMEEFKITVTRNMLIKIATTFSVLCFVKNGADLWKYILILAIGNTISQSVVWIWVPKYVKFVKPVFKEMKKCFLPLLVLFVPVIAVSLYKIMDKIMLKHLGNATEVGLYENAEKIISIPMSFITAVGVVMLPRAAALLCNNNENEVKKTIMITLRYVAIVSYAFMFGLIAVGGEFAPIFFGKDFAMSGPIIQGLSITIPFISVANVIRTQYLIPKGYNRIYITSVISGAVINIILNLILIPMFQSIGAMIGTIVAEMAVFFIQLGAIRKELCIRNVLMRTIPYYIGGAIMASAILIISYFAKVTIPILILEIVIGIIIYSIFSVLFMNCQNDDVLNILKRTFLGTIKKITNH